VKGWVQPSGERPPSGKITRFQPSSINAAAVSPERRLILCRSMGMAATANDHMTDFHVRSKK
jgi:hypothetical protein